MARSSGMLLRGGVAVSGPRELDVSLAFLDGMQLWQQILVLVGIVAGGLAVLICGCVLAVRCVRQLELKAKERKMLAHNPYQNDWKATTTRQSAPAPSSEGGGGTSLASLMTSNKANLSSLKPTDDSKPHKSVAVAGGKKGGKGAGGKGGAGGGDDGKPKSLAEMIKTAPASSSRTTLRHVNESEVGKSNHTSTSLAALAAAAGANRDLVALKHVDPDEVGKSKGGSGGGGLAAMAAAAGANRGLVALKPVPPREERTREEKKIPSLAEIAAEKGKNRVSTRMDEAQQQQQQQQRVPSVRMDAPTEEEDLKPITPAKASDKALRMLGVGEDAIARPFDSDVNSRMKRIAEKSGLAGGIGTAQLAGSIVDVFQERRNKQLDKAKARKERDEMMQRRKSSLKPNPEPEEPPAAKTNVVREAKEQEAAAAKAAAKNATPKAKPGPDRLKAFMSGTEGASGSVAPSDEADLDDEDQEDEEEEEAVPPKQDKGARSPASKRDSGLKFSDSIDDKI
jgi:hypothetical protein